jgi:hypothetical protein
MALLIFRDYPCKAQTFEAERLQRDGWFDAAGWEVDEGYDLRNHWFPGRRVVIGGNRNWSSDAWQKAFEMWKRHGEANGLLLEPDRLNQLEEQAALFRRTFRVDQDQLGPDLDESQRTGSLGESFEAHRKLYWYHDNRRLTNFAHFYHGADVNRRPEAIRARKAFFWAQQMQSRGEPASLVLPEYEKGIEIWKQILQANPEFSQGISVQQDALQLQEKYRPLFREVHGTPLKQVMVLQDFLSQALAGTGVWIPSPQLLPNASLPLPIVGGPFDNMKDSKGQWLIREEAFRNLGLQPRR